MKKSISISTTTPHDVLDDIFTKIFPGHTLLKKPDQDFTEKRRKEGRVGTYLSQIVHAFKCLFEIYRNPRKRYIAREYDGFSLLYLFSPRKTDLMLNVNHNLCTWHGRSVTRILSFRFKVVFIDPGQETLRNFSFLDPIYTEQIFEISREAKWDGKSVLIVVGSKKDQRNFDRAEILRLELSLSSAGYEVKIVGKNHPHGKFFPEDIYRKIASQSIVICVSAYKKFRNSGTLWFLKQTSPVIFVNKGDCCSTQLKGHPNIAEFMNLSRVDDLVREWHNC
jgi:hypothetical protein